MKHLAANNPVLRSAINLAGQVIMIVAVIFLLLRLGQNWNQISADVGRLTVPSLVLSGVLTLAMLVLMPAGWTLALHAVGATISFRLGMSIYYQVSILHYLPGTIWYLPGRAVLCQREGIPLSTFSQSLFLEMFFLLATGGVLAGRAIAIYLGQPALLGLSALAASAAVIVVLFPNRVLSVGGRLPAAGRVNRGKLIAMFVVYMAVWLVYAGAIAILLAALAPTAVPALLDIVAANTAAWLVGFLSLAPTGIGVRELSLATLFGPDTGTMAVVASLCERAMELGLELVLWVVASRGKIAGTN